MVKETFRYTAFVRSIDSTRRAKGLTWKQVAAEVNVSASTLTRMVQGSRPDVDTIANLAQWAGMDIGTFMPGNQPQPGASVNALVSYLHEDPSLSEDAANALEQLITTTYSQLRSDK